MVLGVSGLLAARVGGVTIIGYTDLPSRLAAQSSQLYATNLRHLLADMCPQKDGTVVVDMSDEVILGSTVVKGHDITWPPPAPKPVTPPVTAAAASAAHAKADAAASITAPAISTTKATPAVASAANAAAAKRGFAGPAVAFALGAAVFLLIGLTAPPSFMG